MKFIIHETDGCAWAYVNDMFIFGKSVEEISDTFDMYAAGCGYEVVTDPLSPLMSADEFFS